MKEKRKFIENFIEVILPTLRNKNLYLDSSFIQIELENWGYRIERRPPLTDNSSFKLINIYELNEFHRINFNNAIANANQNHEQVFDNARDLTIEVAQELPISFIIEASEKCLKIIKDLKEKEIQIKKINESCIELELALPYKRELLVEKM